MSGNHHDGGPTDESRPADGSPLRLLVCTAPEREALRLAHALVEERYAACVNIVPGVTSVYRWEGRICEDREVLLLIKTSAAQVEPVTQLIVELHSYAVPEVIAVPMVAGEGNPAYLRWLLDSVASDVDPSA